MPITLNSEFMDDGPLKWEDCMPGLQDTKDASPAKPGGELAEQTNNNKSHI